MEASLKTPAVTAISAGRRRLGALLVADGLVSQHQIEAALARQQIDRRRLGDVLVREGLVSEADLVEALAAQLRLHERQQGRNLQNLGHQQQPALLRLECKSLAQGTNQLQPVADLAPAEPG